MEAAEDPGTMVVDITPEDAIDCTAFNRYFFAKDCKCLKTFWKRQISYVFWRENDNLNSVYVCEVEVEFHQLQIAKTFQKRSKSQL